jgi:phosphoglycolate phosphatase
MNIGSGLRALLLDLDGTLADTAPDMAGALNALLKEEDRETLPYADIRPWVSHGAWALVRLGFGTSLEESRRNDLRERFLAHYEIGLCRETRVFDGLDSLLSRLESAGIPWGIVTNKPGWLTDPLVAALGLASRAGTVVSGDTLQRAKPHPDPLLHAAGVLGRRPDTCIYVGDASRDIEAGRAAGMTTVAATWGYIPAGEDPGEWDADHLAEGPEDLFSLLLGAE